MTDELLQAALDAKAKIEAAQVAVDRNAGSPNGSVDAVYLATLTEGERAILANADANRKQMYADVLANRLRDAQAEYERL